MLLFPEWKKNWIDQVFFFGNGKQTKERCWVIIFAADSSFLKLNQDVPTNYKKYFFILQSLTLSFKIRLGSVTKTVLCTTSQIYQQIFTLIAQFSLLSWFLHLLAVWKLLYQSPWANPIKLFLQYYIIVFSLFRYVEKKYFLLPLFAPFIWIQVESEMMEFAKKMFSCQCSEQGLWWMRGQKESRFEIGLFLSKQNIGEHFDIFYSACIHLNSS